MAALRAFWLAGLIGRAWWPVSGAGVPGSYAGANPNPAYRTPSHLPLQVILLLRELVPQHSAHAARARLGALRAMCMPVRVEPWVGLCLGQPLESGRRLCRTCWRWLCVATYTGWPCMCSTVPKQERGRLSSVCSFQSLAYAGACGASYLRIATVPERHGGRMLPAHVGRLYMVAGAGSACWPRPGRGSCACGESGCANGICRRTVQYVNAMQ